MNGQQLIDLCEVRFQDPTNLLVTEVNWLAYINAAYREFARLVVPRKSTGAATLNLNSNGQLAALSSEALMGRIVRVSLDDGFMLDPLPEDMPAKQRRFYLDQPSEPLWWRQDGNQLFVYPASRRGATTTVAVEYLVEPTALATNTGPLFPESYHDALVAGAVERAYLDDGQPPQADAYRAEFDRYVAAARTDPEITKATP